MKKLSIIIPCYNEKDTIEHILERVKDASLPTHWQREIIIVDDGSHDETRAVLKRISEKHLPASGVHVIFKEKNEGKGSALKAGFTSATGDYIIIQDSDLEYNPDEYADLLVPIDAGHTDVVFGSRALGKNNVPFGTVYYYGGLLVARTFNIFFRTKLSDITTCYKVFSSRYVPALVLQPNNDFVFDAVELTHVLTSGNIIEVPISYTARSRKEGKKLNWRHGLGCVVTIIRIWHGRERFDRHLSSAHRIGKFIISGSLAAVVNFALLYALTEYLHVWYLASSVMSFIAAFIASFILQKYWTFKSRDAEQIKRQLPLHLAVAVFNLALNTALVYLFVDKMGIWYVLAQALATAIIAVESYFAFRKIFS